MKVFVIGAGLIGGMVVEELRAEHDLTVVDLDQAKLRRLAQLYDVATVAASATSGRELAAAGIAEADLVITCTSRDDANLLAGTFARGGAPKATTIVRTSSAEYVEIWREGRLDVDFVVSSELEVARAVSAAIGMPSARHTDTFADGQVKIIEVDVRDGASQDVVGRPLRSAIKPTNSRIAAIIRDRKAILPDGGTVIEPGDRVVLVSAPEVAAAWCELLSPRRGEVHDVVVYGAQELGAAIARALVDQGLDVRVIEPDRARAAVLAEELPDARVFHSAGIDRDFLLREGIARAQTAVFAMRDDPKNLFASTVARLHGVQHTIALAHDPISADVYDHAGIDVTIDPGRVTAEEIVRFAHDPRTQQMSMIEGDRFVLLDITTRPESEHVGVALRDMAIRGALIGAIVRDGRALFPHSEEVLRAGDRVIVFTESSRAPTVERAL